MPFNSLGLAAPLARAATAAGYTAPTPIQLEAIPAVLRGQDVLGLAQTGSGKTAAYLLPLLQRLHDTPREQARRVRVLILVPTRELAAQVGESVRRLGLHLPAPVKTVVAFGGVSINPQMMALRGGADVIVATPGRLLDLVDHNAVKLSAVATLVLDEADRLLDLGFEGELNRILLLLPARRQNLFFSATFPQAVEGLAGSMLHEPTRIEVEATPVNEPNIQQRAIAVDEKNRTQLLRHLMQQNKWERVLVFVATRHAAEMISDKLYKAKVFATAFHGELTQGARTQVLDEFKAKRWEAVITTDLAARGIDIAQLPVVINYDLPRSADDYVHRIGRTARAGMSGMAISFVTPESESHFRLIEKRQGLSIPREQVPGFEPAEVAPDMVQTPLAGNGGNGGIKGKRPSKKDKLRAAGLLPLRTN
jgi:ATP-dependent RNA helicase RhlE